MVRMKTIHGSIDFIINILYFNLSILCVLCQLTLHVGGI